MKKRSNTVLVVALVVVGIAVAAAVFFGTTEGFQQKRYNLPMPILKPQIAEFKKRIEEIKSLENQMTTLDRKVGNHTIGNIPDSKWKASIERMIKNRQDLIANSSAKKTAFNTDVAKAKALAQKSIADIKSNKISKTDQLYKLQQSMIQTWESDLKELNALPLYQR
jgi:hypothetical protein